MKEQELSQIEGEFRYEAELARKSTIMVKWALLIGKRRQVEQFQLAKVLFVKQKGFMALKENLVVKQEQRHTQLKIIEHFSRKEPWVVHMFSKVFLIANYEAAPKPENSLFNSSIPPIQLIDKHGSQPSFEDESQVNICSTVLAKYCFDIWKFRIPELQEKRNKKQMAL